MRRAAIGTRWALAACVTAAAGMWLAEAAWGARPTRASTAKAAAGNTQRTEEDSTARELRAVRQKLDELAANQERILKRLDEIMEEVKIVKIRATLR